jgi:hypothetical protein
MALKNRFSAFFESYPRFIQKDKTRIWSKKRFSAFFESYPRFILSGYGPKNVFQPFLKKFTTRPDNREN